MSKKNKEKVFTIGRLNKKIKKDAVFMKNILKDVYYKDNCYLNYMLIEQLSKMGFKNKNHSLYLLKGNFITSYGYLAENNRGIYMQYEKKDIFIKEMKKQLDSLSEYISENETLVENFIADLKQYN